ncbi:MAG: RDD family protein [Elusimicrobia bacterium]|nr:RDD family protein [Elusimicrobiota bacterium]MDE2314503.1 RDD family protein [Elusimicrobiota bacterium]
MPEERIFEFKPARISERFLAYILDLIPFLAGYAFCVHRFRTLPHGPGLGSRLTLWFLAAYFLYEFVGNLFGATLGKRLMGVRVIGTDGRSLGLFRSLLRAAGYFISTPFFNLGFVVALFHPESRALHDLLAGTTVVELRPKTSARAAMVFMAALALVSLIYGGALYLPSVEPNPADVAAIRQAKEALSVLGRIEESYKASHGAYTASLMDLARASGNVATFRDSLLRMFKADDFVIEADADHYRIQARLKESWAKPVVIEGPAASASR